MSYGFSHSFFSTAATSGTAAAPASVGAAGPSTDMEPRLCESLLTTARPEIASHSLERRPLYKANLSRAARGAQDALSDTLSPLP